MDLLDDYACYDSVLYGSDGAHERISLGNSSKFSEVCYSSQATTTTRADRVGTTRSLSLHSFQDPRNAREARTGQDASVDNYGYRKKKQISPMTPLPRPEVPHSRSTAQISDTQNGHTLTSDIRSIIRSQKCHDFRNLVRISTSPHWDDLEHFLPYRCRIGDNLHHGRSSISWTDAIDANPLSGMIQSHGASQIDQPGLGRRVRANTILAKHARRAGRADNGWTPKSRREAFAHVRDRGPREVEKREQIRGNHFLEQAYVVLHHRAERAQHAGVVEKDVERAVGFDTRGHDTFAVGWVRDIAFAEFDTRDVTYAELAEDVGSLFDVGNEDGGAFGKEELHGGGADTTRTACIESGSRVSECSATWDRSPLSVDSANLPVTKTTLP